MKIETLLMISACVCAISFTITTTAMFKWFREPIAKIHHKLEELVFCPWCFSHWVTFIILLSFPGIQFYQFTGISFVDFFMTAFSIIAISGLGHFVLLRAYAPVASAMAVRAIQKIQDEPEDEENKER